MSKLHQLLQDYFYVRKEFACVWKIVAFSKSSRKRSPGFSTIKNIPTSKQPKGLSKLYEVSDTHFPAIHASYMKITYVNSQQAQAYQKITH